MANEIQFDAGATGLATYVLLRNSTSLIYQLLSGQFVTFSGGDYVSYVISGTEQASGTGYYTASVPSGIANGYYNVLAKQQLAGTATQSDLTLANSVDLWWTGSGIMVFPANFPALLISAAGLVTASVTSISSGLLSGQQVTLVSGQSFVASGINSVVPVSTLSGIQPISGTFVSVPIASISGAVGNSGAFVNVPIATISGVNAVVPVGSLSGGLFLASGSLSGQQVTLVSGQSYTASGINSVVPIASLSGVIANSGLFVSVPIASISGAVANSGLFVSVPIASISGVSAAVSTTSLSGTTVTANVALWQGVPPNALISSGRVDAAFNIRTGVARSGTSNTIQLDAGVPTGISGVYDGAIITLVGGTGIGRSRTIQNMGSSGIATVFPAWDASGVPDTTTIFTLTPGAQAFSGQVNPASGANTVVPVSTLSGVIANSGLFVSVPIASISGVNSVVPTASISGTTTIASLLSGQSTLTYSGQLSGQPITLLSGLSYTASGISPASGAFVTASVTLTSGQVFLASGTSVLVYSGSLSGQPITLLSGQSYPASGVNTVVPIASISGVTTVVLGSSLSGSLYLASGSLYKTTFASGVLGTSGGLPTAWGSSGSVSVGQNLDKSGYTSTSLSGANVVVPPATLSGVFANVPLASISGVQPASGANVIVPIDTISGVSAVASVTSISSGLLSGQQVTLTSGQSYTASGIFVTATATIASGQVFLASGQAVSLNSGQSVLVYSGQLSGQPIAGLSGFIYPASGIFVTATATIASGQVFLASGQSVSLNSGQSVLVYSGQLSGQPIAGLSGFIYPASGVFVNATATIASGQVFLASGQAVSLNSGQSVLVYSGQLSGQQVAATAVVNSGLFVTVPISSISGVNTLASVTSISSGLLSGQQVTAASGAFVTIPVSTLSGVVANSGLFVSVPITSISGVNSVVPVSTLSGIYPASGSLSGQQVVTLTNLDKTGYGVSSLTSGILSGQQVTLTSGQSYTASGIFVNAANVTIGSGQIFLASGQSVSLNSGQFVLLNSGQSVLVYSGQLSGQPIAGLSGFLYPASGVNVTATATISSGQVFLASGQQVSLNSGQVTIPASGAFVNASVFANLDKSGYTLSSSGLDTVQVEVGMNMRQAQAAIAAGVAGRLSGAGAPVMFFDAANASGTNRITAGVDGSGNRISVILNLPT